MKREQNKVLYPTSLVARALIRKFEEKFGAMEGAKSLKPSDKRRMKDLKELRQIVG